MADKLSRNDQIELANMLQSDDKESIFLALSIIYNSPKPKSFAVIEIDSPHKISIVERFDYFVREAVRKIFWDIPFENRFMLTNLFNYGF